MLALISIRTVTLSRWLLTQYITLTRKLFLKCSQHSDICTLYWLMTYASMYNLPFKGT